MTSTTTTTMPAPAPAPAPAFNWTDAVIFKDPEDICENCGEAVGELDGVGGGLLCTCNLCEDCGDEVGWAHIIVHSFGCVGLCTRCSLKDGPHCPRTHSNHEHDPCAFCVSAYKHEEEEQEQIKRELEDEEHEDDCTCNECEDDFTNAGEKAMK